MHSLSPHSYLAALGLSVSACVISPVDQAAVTDRHEHFTVTGYGSEPGQQILIRAWNHDRAAWELVDSTVTRDSSIGNDVKLYSYAGGGVRLGKRYWHPTSLPCTRAGTARLEVHRVTAGEQDALATFTEEGMECLGDELALGAEPAAAGLACRTGEEVRIAAPPQCAPTGAPKVHTGSWLTNRITDDVDTVEVGGEHTWLAPRFDASRRVRVSTDLHAYHGVRALRLAGRVTVACRRVDESRREVTSDHEARATPPSSELEQTLGVSLTFDLPSVRARCGTEPMISIRGEFAVTGTFAGGSTISLFAPMTFTAY